MKHVFRALLGILLIALIITGNFKAIDTTVLINYTLACFSALIVGTIVGLIFVLVIKMKNFKVRKYIYKINLIDDNGTVNSLTFYSLRTAQRKAIELNYKIDDIQKITTFKGKLINLLSKINPK